MLVAIVALVAALAGTAVGGVAVTPLNKKDKKQVTKIAKKLDKKIKLKPGPKGDSGADATNLFAYISDGGAGPSAELVYGEGATSVSDPDGASSFASPYVVTFNRNLSGCVAHATVGEGDPSGGGLIPRVFFTTVVDGSTVRAWGRNADDNGSDSSFLVSVFC